MGIIQLATVGLVDWNPICTFLRCIRFICDGVNVSTRQFMGITPILNDDSLKAYLASARMHEEQHWNVHRPLAAYIRTI